MKRFAMVAAAALSCALMATTAFAHDHRGGRGDREWRSHHSYDRGYREGRRDERRAERRRDQRGWDRRDWRGPPVVVVPSGPPRHYGSPRWHRGDRLPSQYRQRHYVVHDWRARNFRAPPRGYQWVNTGGAEYLLEGIATGVILQSIIGR